MRAISPLVKFRKRIGGETRDYALPLYVHYQNVMAKFEPQEGEDDTERIGREKRKAKVFGPELNILSTNDFDEMSMLKELSLFDVWPTFDIFYRARIIAWYRLHNMQETLRHIKQIEEQAKSSGKTDQTSEGMGRNNRGRARGRA